MDYILSCGDETSAIAVEALDDGTFVLRRGTETWRAEVEETYPGQLMITLPESQGARFCVWTDPKRATVESYELKGEVVDLRTQALRQSQALSRASGPQPITTPMPGRVAAVLVEEGQMVAEGDGLVVVEAMKMENELRAPRSGVVRNLSATLGSQVSGGAILCSVH